MTVRSSAVPGHVGGGILVVDAAVFVPEEAVVLPDHVDVPPVPGRVALPIEGRGILEITKEIVRV